MGGIGETAGAAKLGPGGFSTPGTPNSSEKTGFRDFFKTIPGPATLQILDRF